MSLHIRGKQIDCAKCGTRHAKTGSRTCMLRRVKRREMEEVAPHLLTLDNYVAERISHFSFAALQNLTQLKATNFTLFWKAQWMEELKLFWEGVSEDHSIAQMKARARVVQDLTPANLVVDKPYIGTVRLIDGDTREVIRTIVNGVILIEEEVSAASA